MSEQLKRMLYLSQVEKAKDKKSLKESIDKLIESKQTESDSLRILRASGIDDKQSIDLINKFKNSDTSRNQILLPIMSKMYGEVGNNGLNELLRLFVSVSDLINTQKISTPILTANGYNVNKKDFPNYLKFAEFIHGLEGMNRGHSEMQGKINLETSEKPIFNGNGIKIFDGNDIGRCIKYTTGGLTGKHYQFCIGQPANTMWQSYRDSKLSTFYFITDENRDLEDPLHIVVYDNTEHGVELTDANNRTGHIAEFGEDTEEYNNYLRSKGVDVNKLLVNKEMTPEEKSDAAKLGIDNPSLDWFKSLSYREQSSYVGRGHLLSDEQFNYLWQFKNDNAGGFKLLKQYVDNGQAIPESQFNILTSDNE
jgi:hypothetical protein